MSIKIEWPTITCRVLPSAATRLMLAMPLVAAAASMTDAGRGAFWARQTGANARVRMAAAERALPMRDVARCSMMDICDFTGSCPSSPKCP